MPLLRSDPPDTDDDRLGWLMTGQRGVGLVLAVVADAAFGARRSAKPTRLPERAAQAVESVLRRDHPLTGAAYVVSLGGGATALAVGLDRVTGRHRGTRLVATAVTGWYALGGAELAALGTVLARELENGDLGAARDTLRELGQRDTEYLDRVDLARVSVETVAQRACANVVSPLLAGAVAGIPGMVAARTVVLLRRRAVPQRERGERFRRVLELTADLVELVPTRVAAALTVAAAPVVGGSARSAWCAWRRDTFAHPSPNEGRVEAAYAGALEVRLGGRSVYPRGVVELPVLGDGRNPDAGHVARAVELSRVVGWSAGFVSAVLATVTGARRVRSIRRS